MSRGGYSSILQDGNRHIYYNITMEHQDVNNPYSGPTQATFEENRTVPILNNPSLYEGAIVRFSAATDEIPILNKVPIAFDEDRPAFIPTGATGNNNINKTYGSITLSYFGTPTGGSGPTGATTQTYLEWTPENNVSPMVPIFTAQNPTRKIGDPYYALKTYQHQLDLMNTSIAGAYYGTNFSGGASDTSPPKLANAPAPFLTFDANTQLVSLICHESFNPNYGNNPTTGTIELYMNVTNYNLFKPSLESILNGYDAPQGQVYHIVVKNEGDNFLPTMGTGATGTVEQFTPPDILDPPEYNAAFYYQIGDICVSAGLLYISLTANNINNTPVSSATNWKNYVIGFTGGFAQNGYLQMQQEFNTLPNWNDFQSLIFTSASLGANPEIVAALDQGGSSNYRPVLTDFQPLVTNGPDARGSLQYFPQGPYRMFNLNGTTPLNKMDLQVYWSDNYRNIYPLTLSAHNQATVKIMFRRKDFTGS